jgi:phosphonoacetaldehyde hydrolase
VNRERKLIKLVVFDMAGTTVDDNIEGAPLVLKSYHDAFTRYGVKINYDTLNAQRGKDKLSVIKEFGGEKFEDIYNYFLEALIHNVDRVKEINGVTKVFNFLKENNVLVSANTGFPEEVARLIIKKLKWEEKGLIDSWICSEMVGVSRPDPMMITRLMELHNISDSSTVIKVDDTVTGIQEGLNAGVITLGVLSGTQTRVMLEKASPYSILKSVKNLPIYLRKNKLI